jgi:tRNA(Arg) A34 adenosine deaminase TadA
MLFSTGEPCAMCFSLATEANLTTIVYGVSLTERAWQENNSVTPSPLMIEIIGGVLRDECLALYRSTNA